MKKTVKSIKLVLNAEKIRTIDSDLHQVVGGGLCSTTVRRSEICTSNGVRNSCEPTCGDTCTSSTTF